MSRKIKFRAWDTMQGGKFEYWSFPENKYDGIFWEMIKHKSFKEPQQYTGLKDKNGKEIYEGDILCGYGNIYTDELDISSAFVVKWDKNGWEIFKESETQYCIIGNIYENGELMEKISL